ncbi:MAG: hypothetical protein ILO53_03415 [Clostridia bacterium]|nr:hypothetical protein [Clostridia bacterium]
MKMRPEKSWWKLFVRWCVIAVVLVAVTLLTRGVLDRINAISLSVESILGETLDLGTYTGLRNELERGFGGKIFKVDKLLEAVKENEFYDEDLLFEREDGSILLYIVKNGSIFSLRINGFQCNLADARAFYSRQNLIGIVDAYGDNVRFASGYRTGEWCDDELTMKEIQRLYSKLPPDYYTVKEDSVYIKGYERDSENQLTLTDDYVFRVFERDGRIYVEPIGVPTHE